MLKVSQERIEDSVVRLFCATELSEPPETEAGGREHDIPVRQINACMESSFPNSHDSPGRPWMGFQAFRPPGLVLDE